MNFYIRHGSVETSFGPQFPVHLFSWFQIPTQQVSLVWMQTLQPRCQVRPHTLHTLPFSLKSKCQGYDQPSEGQTQRRGSDRPWKWAQGIWAGNSGENTNHVQSEKQKCYQLMFDKKNFNIDDWSSIGALKMENGIHKVLAFVNIVLPIPLSRGHLKWFLKTLSFAMKEEHYKKGKLQPADTKRKLGASYPCNVRGWPTAPLKPSSQSIYCHLAGSLSAPALRNIPCRHLCGNVEREGGQCDLYQGSHSHLHLSFLLRNHLRSYMTRAIESYLINPNIRWGCRHFFPLRYCLQLSNQKSLSRADG